MRLDLSRSEIEAMLSALSIVLSLAKDVEENEPELSGDDPLSPDRAKWEALNLRLRHELEARGLR